MAEMDGESRKVRSTKRRVTDALMQRLAEEPIDKITVGEICGLARINRSTFYNHFSDIYDVRDQCERDILIAIESMIPAWMAKVLLDEGDLSVERIGAVLGPYYDYLNVLLNGGDPSFPQRLRTFAHGALAELFPARQLSIRQEYIFNGVASMQLGLISYWLSTGRSIELGEMYDLIRDLIRNGVQSELLRG